METHKNLYQEICSKRNLVLAWKKARKGKTKKEYVINFEKELPANLNKLHKELTTQTYSPRPLETFIVRDPKTRKISKAHFRDRIIHHALCNVIEPIFDRTFIYENCANRKGKGNLFALQRLNDFHRKVSKNNSRKCFALKADIKHYFREINRITLLEIIGRKIACTQTIWLIKTILERERERGSLWII